MHHCFLKLLCGKVGNFVVHWRPSQHMQTVQNFTNYYVFHGRVTLLFANNSLTQGRITMKFLHNIFLNHEVFFSSHTMFINASTKEYTLVNNAISSHGIAIERFLYYKMVANVYQELDNIFENKTYSILICQSFPFKLVQSFRSNRDGKVGL